MLQTNSLPYPKKMRAVTILATLILSLSVLFSCNNNDEEVTSEEILQEIAGNWTATKATFNGIDLVAMGGSATLSLQNTGNFTLTIQQPESSAMTFTGQLTYEDGYLKVEYDTNPGEYEYFSFNYDANFMQIGATILIDFDENGTEEPVVLLLDMVR